MSIRHRMDARRFEDWEFPSAFVLGSKAAVDYALAISLQEIKEDNYAYQYIKFETRLQSFPCDYLISASNEVVSSLLKFQIKKHQRCYAHYGHKRINALN
ncbi:MAG: hypothetical protein U5K54_18950 [Cytophagales bacterium]|nr:hypothetical protein [Cytophagales bacterium]